MGTCGCCGDDSAVGDCSEALSPLRCCRPVYQGAEARDLVRGPDLQRIIDQLVDGHNNQAAALAQIMGPDCTLLDEIVRCRHLNPEVGQACLVDGQIIPPVPIPPGPVPGGPVLDYPVLSDASGGWGLRRLFSSYTGPAIAVRRASDNAIIDIGFADNGLIDTGALLAFGAGTDVFVRTLYDQQVQGPWNLIQPTPAAQPKIYDNVTGFVVNGSGRLAMFFDAVDDTFYTDLGSLVPHTTEMLVELAMERHGDGSGYEWEIDTSVPGGAGSGPRVQWNRPSSNSQYWQTTIGSKGANSNTHYQDLNKAMLVGGACLENGSPITVQTRVNGSVEGSNPTGGFVQNGQGQIWVGSNSGGSNFSAMVLSEIVYYHDEDWLQLVPDINESLVAVLEANMMATWGVTPS